MKLVRSKKRCNDSVVTLTSDFAIPLKSFSDEQIEKIKDSLTFNNPAYASAKRFSPYSRVYVDPLITYYRSSCGYLHVPAGTDLSPLNDPPVEDKRITVYSSTVPKFVLELREDQKNAADSYLKMNKGYKLRAAVQLSTGMGKTVLALYLAAKLKQKTLVIVHKDDLVVGWQKDIDLCFNHKCVPGLIKAKSRKVGSFITIATAQTLSRMDEDELSMYLNSFGFVVLDEMHHCVLGDTQVVLEDGGVTSMKSIGNSVKVLGGTTRNSFSLEAPVFRLHAKHGFIDGSADHPTFCFDKRKYFDRHTGQCDFSNAVPEVKAITDLDSNYVIPVLRKIPHVVKNSTPVHSAKFAAMIMCDGHLDPVGNRVKVNVAKDKEYYCSLFEQSGVPFKKSNDNRGNLTLWCTDADLKRNLESEWLIPRGYKSSSICVPEFMYYAPLETIKAFIEVCFSCEGDLSINGHNNCRVNFSTTSRMFAQGISMLLKKFGIVANMQVIYKDAQNDVYRLSCSGDMFNLFMDTFTILDRKMTNIRNKGTCNHNRIYGDYILSDVKYIDSLGYSDTVYDFEVTGSHSFIANGILTHNCPASMFEFVNRFTSRYRLGLTATAERKDGLAHVMKLYFGDFCYKYKSTGKEKDILPVTVIRRSVDFLHIDPVCAKDERGRWFVKDFRTDPDSYRLKKGEQFISDVPYNVRPRLVFNDYSDMIVRRIKDMVMSDIAWEYYQGHSCIVFFSLKSQVDDFAEYLHREKKIPVCDIHKYYGNNSAKENNRVMKEVENRRQGVTLTTYSKTSEGTNVRQWEVAFLVSSINDAKNTEQVVGRVRRVKEGCKLPRAVVYDYRCPFVYSLASHASTRDARYRKLGAKFANSNNQKESESRGHSAKMFTRGYAR